MGRTPWQAAHLSPDERDDLRQEVRIRRLPLHGRPTLEKPRTAALTAQMASSIRNHHARLEGVCALERRCVQDSP